MLSPDLSTLRVFLHILSATIWVGGQVVLAALVPYLRKTAPEALPGVARTFSRVAWPAYIVLISTGVWSLLTRDVANTTTVYQATLHTKMALAFLSGAAVLVHQFGKSRVALAVGGALGLLAALGATFVAVLLATGS